MKKLLVMSDTHGHIANIAAALKRVEDFDIIVHLGDNARDAEHIRKMTHKPIYSVRGNCDFYASAGDELDLHIEGVRILCVHGHKQAVKSSLLRLSLLAGEKQADLVLFGHTHQPRELQSRGVRLYNPGSLGEPRSMRPSLGLVMLDNGTIRIKTVRL